MLEKNSSHLYRYFDSNPLHESKERILEFRRNNLIKELESNIQFSSKVIERNKEYLKKYQEELESLRSQVGVTDDN